MRFAIISFIIAGFISPPLSLSFPCGVIYQIIYHRAKKPIVFDQAKFEQNQKKYRQLLEEGKTLTPREYPTTPEEKLAMFEAIARQNPFKETSIADIMSGNIEGSAIEIKQKQHLLIQFAKSFHLKRGLHIDTASFPFKIKFSNGLSTAAIQEVTKFLYSLNILSSTLMAPRHALHQQAAEFFSHPVQALATSTNRYINQRIEFEFMNFGFEEGAKRLGLLSPGLLAKWQTFKEKQQNSFSILGAFSFNLPFYLMLDMVVPAYLPAVKLLNGLGLTKSQVAWYYQRIIKRGFNPVRKEIESRLGLKFKGHIERYWEWARISFNYAMGILLIQFLVEDDNYKLLYTGIVLSTTDREDLKAHQRATFNLDKSRLRKFEGFKESFIAMEGQPPPEAEALAARLAQRLANETPEEILEKEQANIPEDYRRYVSEYLGTYSFCFIVSDKDSYLID